MKELLQYIYDHTQRGECQCGKCRDYSKENDRPSPEHSADVHFFLVAPYGEPERDTVRALLKAQYPRWDRLMSGPSYIEIGAELGSQDAALRLIGLGKLVGLWGVITPKVIGIDGPEADALAGGGFIMTSGVSE